MFSTSLSQGTGLLKRLRCLSARPATDQELLRAHTAAHVAWVDTFYAKAKANEGGFRVAQVAALHKLSGSFNMRERDLYVGSETAAAARLAAGCSIRAA